MISHQHKCIFIHIPKTAGSSVNRFYLPQTKLDWRFPNYDVLYGWCPKRKIHLQHATAKQLLELDLISEENWKSYYKFSFVRNPWDRSYSDYLWMMKDTKIKGSFKDYALKQGVFKKVLTDRSHKSYRGDHLISQSDFLEVSKGLEIDYIGRFENFSHDISKINAFLKVNRVMDLHEKKNKKRHNHYSLFYTGSNRKLVSKVFEEDINQFGYKFLDEKVGFKRLKNII